MSSRRYILLTLAALTLLVSALCLGRRSTQQKALPSADLMRGLTEKSGEDLHQFLRFLRTMDKSHLSEPQIDEILDRLLKIQREDPYRRPTTSKSGVTRMVYRNRGAAHDCIFRFKFQKIANRIRKLPMEQRVAQILDGMLNPPKLEYDTTESFARELVVAGKEAVPYIVHHKPKVLHYSSVIRALAEIGDPRGVDYIIDALHTEGKDYRFLRPEAARALAKFRGEKVVRALIEALRDQTFQDVDRAMRQRAHSDHKPRIGRYYSVQHAASRSLSTITGHFWGHLYNEDYKTWEAWLSSGNSKDTFNPRTVVRTPKEMKELIGFLYHRYMSGRPNPWDLSPGILGEEEGIRSLVQDLKALGKGVASLLVKECKARVAESAIWREELEEWTRKLLLGLKSEEAIAAVRELARDTQGEISKGN